MYEGLVTGLVGCLARRRRINVLAFNSTLRNLSLPDMHDLPARTHTQSARAQAQKQHAESVVNPGRSSRFTEQHAVDQQEEPGGTSDRRWFLEHCKPYIHNVDDTTYT